MAELDEQDFARALSRSEKSTSEVPKELQSSNEAELQNNGNNEEASSEQSNDQAREPGVSVHAQPARSAPQVSEQPGTDAQYPSAQVQQLSPEGYDLVKMRRDLTGKNMKAAEITDTYPVYFRKRGLLKVDIDNLSNFFNLKLNGEYLLNKRQGRRFLPPGRQFQIESFRKGEMPISWEVTDDDADDNREPPAKRPRKSTAPEEERGATAQPEQPATPPPQRPEGEMMMPIKDHVDYLRQEIERRDEAAREESKRRHEEKKAQIEHDARTERRRMELETERYKIYMSGARGFRDPISPHFAQNNGGELR